MAKDYQDWDALGHSIEDIIDQAIKSKNYQELSRTITHTIDKATSAGSDALWKALDLSGSMRARSSTQKTTVTTTTTATSAPPPKAQLPALYGSPNGQTATGILKTVFGGMLTIAGFTLSLISGIFALVGMAGSIVVPLCFGVGSLGLGSWLLTGGIRVLGRVSRYKVYLKTLGQKTHMSLERLARSVGKNEKFVRKELSGMIDEGLFLEGHWDKEQQNLITSNETFQSFEKSRMELEARQREEAARATVTAPAKAVSPKVQEVLDRGNAYLQEIRRCNDEIPGEEISAKIDRMDAIVLRIFERAEAHPEIIPDLKKLMDYYLPMTIKLLNAYADMDRQPIQGETILASKQEIDATLDTLNLAFEKLLDSVFQDTAMDVSSDISVLHTLLAQEGLTGDDFKNNVKE